MWLLVLQLGLLCIGGNTQSMDGLFTLDIIGNNSINPVSTHFGMDENVKYYQEYSDFTDFTDFMKQMFSANTINLRLYTGDAQLADVPVKNGGICKDVCTNCVKVSEKISGATFYWNIIGSFIIIGIMFVTYYFSIIGNIYYTLPVMFVYMLLLFGNVNAENIMQKITASDSAYNDDFGRSVSVWNDIAVVGSYLDDDKGSAYIFEKHSEVWIQTEKLVASDGASNDYFGYSVAVYDSIIVVGAYGDDNPKGISCGSAYIFEKKHSDSGFAWEETKLVASNGAQYDYFGYSVAIHKNFVVIGALLAGSAYIFENVGDSWVERRQIFAGDRSSWDCCGISVSIHENIVAVGAPHEETKGSNSGSVYVFEKNGSTWPTYSYDKLNAWDGAPYDRFGHSVSVYNNTVLVGSENHDISNKGNSGAAYIFEKIQGSWIQTNKLFPLDGSSFDYFGFSVSLFENIALIGSYGDDDMASNSGSAYIFERKHGNWIETEKLVAYDGASGDAFGYDVSIHGNHILVGACSDDDTGSAYIYSCNWVWNVTTDNYLINYKWKSCGVPTNNSTETPTNIPTSDPASLPSAIKSSNFSLSGNNSIILRIIIGFIVLICVFAICCRWKTVNKAAVNEEKDKGIGDDEGFDNDGFNMNNIDQWKYTDEMMKKIKKSGRVTLGYGCAPSLIKELIFIEYTYKKRCLVGNSSQKGKWIHTNELGDSPSTLRRKKPALKLIAWDHKKYIQIENDNKHGGNGYMDGDHAKEVKEETQKLIDGNKKPVNPSLWDKYVDVYGDASDKALMKEMKNAQ